MISPMEISIAAETILKIGGFPITNTLILAWTVMGILVAFGAAATYRLAPVLGGIQNVAEAILKKEGTTSPPTSFANLSQPRNQPR